MSDRDFLLYAFKGNLHALNYVLLVAAISQAWDDLHDQDKAVSSEALNKMMCQALIELPRNPFYRTHFDELSPVMMTGILNWLVANRIESEPSSPVSSLEISHVLRFSIADVALYAASLIGGRAWAESVGVEMRLRSSRSDFAEYVDSLKSIAPRP